MYNSASPLNISRTDYIVPALSGCLLVYYLCLSTWLNKLKFMIYIGSHTLVILALHFLCFKLVCLLYIIFSGSDIRLLAQFAVLNNAPEYLWLPYTLVGVFIPIILRYSYLYIYECFIYNFRGKRRV